MTLKHDLADANYSESMSAVRIPPIQCLLTFEALARLRSVTLAAEELCVTPSAVSHRVRQLEQILGAKLFGRADFSLTTDGNKYLAHVREGLAILQKFPSSAAAPGKRKLRLAVTPTFARSLLIPRLRQFTEAYPEIDLTLQVSIPLLDVVAEDADLIVRFGAGRYADMEFVCLAKDEVAPLASPAYVREHGPFHLPQDLEGAALLRSPLEPWRTWFAASGLDWPEPVDGSQFNDIGLMCDCAAAGMGNWARPGWKTAHWCAWAPATHSCAPCRARMPTTCAGAPAPWTAGKSPPSPTGCANPWVELKLQPIPPIAPNPSVRHANFFTPPPRGIA